MAELAGLVLGGVPLILTALENYRSCLEKGKNYIKYQETLSSIRNNVFVQQQQFYRTVAILGFHEPPKYKELEERLQSLYPEEYDEIMRVIRWMEDIVRQLMDKLEVDVQGKPSGKQDRVEWEWRRVKRSLGSREREKLIDQLQYWNTALSRCLERPEVPLEDSTPMVRALQARFNAVDCDAVRQQARNVMKTLDSCWQCSCAGQHRTSIDLDWHLNKPTSSPVFRISLSQDDALNGSSTPSYPKWHQTQVVVDENFPRGQDINEEEVLGPPLKKIKLNVAPLQPSTRTNNHSKSLFPRAIQNWASNASSSSPLGVPSPSSAETLPTDNTSSKHTEIQSLCQYVRGLEKGNDGLGFLLIPGDTKRVHITPLPKSQTMPTETLSLHSLLPPNRPPAYLSLSRRKRLETAAAATWAVLLLCGTPWLTETWDRDGLCFFLEKDLPNTTDSLAKTPCISRTQSTTSVSNANTVQRFRNMAIRNKTIFALGVLLIELSLNRTFDELAKEENTIIGSSSSSALDDYRVATILVDRVYQDAGDSYGYACQRCINYEFPGREVTKTFDFAQFRQHFYNLVVAPVQATFSTIPR